MTIYQVSLTCISSIICLGISSCSEEKEYIGCGWGGRDNCWKESVAQVIECAGTLETGRFNADRTTCSFTNGAVISFASAVPKGLNDYWFDFDISKDATSCLKFKASGSDPSNEYGSKFKFTTTLGIFTWEATSAVYKYTCSNGDEFEITEEDEWDCDINTMPGYGASFDYKLQFYVDGYGDSMNFGTVLFNCQDP